MNSVNNKEKEEIDFLEKIVPGLKEKKILEIGSGRGEFLTAMKSKGYDIVGIEPDPYKFGIKVGAILAPGEEIPFASETFDFLYCNNVIEHCRNPIRLLQESHRVLKSSGFAYFTVINRFAFRDPHYHLNFLNWLPRWLAERYIIIRGRSKKPLPHPAESRNEFSEMHYFTFNGFKKIARKVGFADITDLKEYKIKHPELITTYSRSKVSLVRIFPFIYRLARLFYLSGFRLLMRKTPRVS